MPYKANRNESMQNCGGLVPGLTGPPVRWAWGTASKGRDDRSRWRSRGRARRREPSPPRVLHALGGDQGDQGDQRPVFDRPEVTAQLALFDRWLVRLDPGNEARVLDHLFPEQRAHIAACRRPAIDHDPDGHGGALLIEHEAEG